MQKKIGTLLESKRRVKQFKANEELKLDLSGLKANEENSFPQILKDTKKWIYQN